MLVIALSIMLWKTFVFGIKVYCDFEWKLVYCWSEVLHPFMDREHYCEADIEKKVVCSPLIKVQLLKKSSFSSVLVLKKKKLL